MERPPGEAPVSRPGTWLLAVGWRRRLGPLRADEAPRRAPRKVNCSAALP
ncbi:MAG TPA: hypothetical protein VGQ83_29420 [Polyangia bacterium]